MTFAELKIGDAFSMNDGHSVGIKTAEGGAFFFGCDKRYGSNWVTFNITTVVKLNLRITDLDGKEVVCA